MITYMYTYFLANFYLKKNYLTCFILYIFVLSEIQNHLEYKYQKKTIAAKHGLFIF